MSGGGAGFMLDMIQRSAYNKNAREESLKRRKPFSFNTFDKNSSRKIEKKEISEDQLGKIREEFHQKEKKHRKKQIISILLTALCVLTALYLLYLTLTDKL